MSPEVPIASPLPTLDAFLSGSSLHVVNSVLAVQLDSPFAGGRNRPRVAPGTCLDSLSTAQSGQKDQMAALRRSPAGSAPAASSRCAPHRPSGLRCRTHSRYLFLRCSAPRYEAARATTHLG